MVKTLANIEIARSLLKKGVGLMGRKNFGTKQGLLLTETTAVHTFFVRFPIDLAFLDKNLQVVKIVENLKPWSISPLAWKARHVLELPAGTIAKNSLEVGDTLKVE